MIYGNIKQVHELTFETDKYESLICACIIFMFLLQRDFELCAYYKITPKRMPAVCMGAEAVEG